MKKDLCTALAVRLSLLCVLAFFMCPSVLRAQIITTYAGNGSNGYTGDGHEATSATLDSITSIAYDKFGNLYINDQHSHCVRRVSPSGNITTLAGNGTAGFSGDGGMASAAKLHDNWGVAVDTSGNVYITDQTNQCVRKVTPFGVISTIAGIPGSAGYTGDGGPATAAKLNTPIGIATDRFGNVYIGDYSNKVIRKVSASGIITTVAGNGTYGYDGDGGPALSAQLSYVYGLATDYSGNLYICDGYNNRVRKVTMGGTISTIAGNGSAGYGGDGGAATSAQLYRPTGVYVAPSGDIYIADCKNSRIRKVSSGIITTVAGNGTDGYNGDGIDATAASINSPLSVSADPDGNVVIADRRNYRVRRIIKSVTFVNGKSQMIESCENAVLSLNNALKVQDFYAGYTDTWSQVMAPVHGYVSVSYSAVSSGGVIVPVGLTYMPVSGFVGTDSFKVQVTNGAVTDVTTIRVKVDPVLTTAGIITGPSEVCAGSSINLSSGMPGGTWSCADDGVSMTIAGPNCTVSGINAGIAAVSYTVSNFCGPVSSTKIVTVHPLPDPGTLSGADAVCKGSATTISATIPGGTWNSSAGHASVAGGVVTGVDPGVEVVRYTVSNAWCQATTTHTIVVEIFPSARTISGVSQLCVGETITVTDSVSYGGWIAGNTNATVAAATPVWPSYGLVTGVATGLDNISYSITNSCGTDYATHQVFVAPLPDEPVINAHDGELSVTGLYQSYQWLKNGIAIPGATADMEHVQAEALYAVIVGNSYGCKATSKPYAFGCDPSKLIVYPNPVVSAMQISWCRLVTTRVVSIDGRIDRVFSNTNQVDLSDLPDGLYVVEIFDDNKSVRTLKVTKLVGK